MSQKACRTSSISNRARALFEAHEHGRAMELLQSALHEHPNDADLLTELGVCLCYLQREDEALELLERGWGARRSEILGGILGRYLVCRSLAARRLGVEDSKGQQLIAKLERRIGALPSDVGIRLSACLIVKNEEAHLERCLASLKGHVDEMVVVDTGSTDRTLEIAEAFGAKVGHFPWCDDFSAARNYSLQLASGDWALWIDADEEVDPASWSAILEGLIRPHFGGYFVRIENVMDVAGESLYIHHPIRVFQRLSGVRFEGRIHEQVIQSLERLNLPTAVLKEARIRHYGYRPEVMAEKDKVARTISMLEREVREAPKDAFHWFNLANAYSVAKRPHDAIHACHMCLRHSEEGNAFATVAYHILASSLVAVGRPEEALQACAEARERGQFTILNRFEEAHALFCARRFEEALAAVEDCLCQEWPDGLTGDYGIVTHKSHSLKGQILCEMGHADQALPWLEHALGVDPGFSIAVFWKGVALERLNKLEDALPCFTSLFDDADFGAPSLLAAARIRFSECKLREAAQLYERCWRVRPEASEPWIGWLKCLEALGDSAALVQAYQAYSDRHEPSADVLINWGRALEESGDAGRALQLLVEAVQREPTNANAYFNAGDLLYRQSQYADAAHLYESGLRLNPANAEGWFTLGNSVAQLGMATIAKSAYEQALALAPDHQGALHNLELVSVRQRAA